MNRIIYLGIRTILLPFSAALLVACVPGKTNKTYSSPAPAAEKIATIETPAFRNASFFSDTILQIDSVDKKSAVAAYPGSTHSVIVLPGRHQMAFRLLRSRSCITPSDCGYDIFHGRLSFMAEADKTYRIDAVYERGKLWSWLQDTASGDIVAGERPARVPPPS